MTEHKALKRDIRARMAKTGERYTAARAHLVAMVGKKAAPSYDPTLLTTSDAVMRRRSGRGWGDWIEILDAWGATKRTHTEIARFLMGEHQVPGWWAQAVTVGYERVRGMRALHGKSDGFYVTVSKTFKTDIDAVVDAFMNTRRRKRWFGTSTLALRTSTPGKSARFDFGDGASRVIVWFTPKGSSKATVSLSHERLAEKALVEEMRAFWKERLARLGEQLER